MSLIRTMSKIYSHQKEMNLEGNWAFHISIGNKSLWKFHKQNDYLIGILFFCFFLMKILFFVNETKPTLQCRQVYLKEK